MMIFIINTLLIPHFSVYWYHMNVYVIYNYCREKTYMHMYGQYLCLLSYVRRICFFSVLQMFPCKLVEVLFVISCTKKLFQVCKIMPFFTL